MQNECKRINKINGTDNPNNNSSTAVKEEVTHIPLGPLPLVSSVLITRLNKSVKDVNFGDKLSLAQINAIL